VTTTGRIAFGVLVAVAILAFLLPLVWTIPPDATDPVRRLASPSAEHPLGTDEIGRDILSRLAYGGRVTLVVGVAAMLTALVVGIVVGGIAGFYGGVVDTLLMRLTDAMLAIPAFFLVLVVITVLGSDIKTLVLVIGGLSWMPVARVMYGETLRWKVAEFVVAAESLGASSLRVLVRHVLPQAVSVLLVSASLGVGNAILTESAVSYLGLGVQPPTPSWGNMLQRAQQYVFTSPALAFYPGAAIMLVVLAFNFAGDAVRDRFDPRARSRTRQTGG